MDNSKRQLKASNVQNGKSILSKEIKLWMKIVKLCNKSEHSLIHREMNSIPTAILDALGGELQFLFNQLKLRNDRKNGSLVKLKKKLEDKSDQDGLDKSKVVTLILWGLRVLKLGYQVQVQNQQCEQINVESERNEIIPNENDQRNQLFNSEEPENEANLIVLTTSSNKDVQINQQVSNFEEQQNETSVSTPIKRLRKSALRQHKSSRSSSSATALIYLDSDDEIIPNENNQNNKELINLESEDEIIPNENNQNNKELINLESEDEIIPNESDQSHQILISEEHEVDESNLNESSQIRLRRSTLEQHSYKSPHSSSANALIFNTKKQKIMTEQVKATTPVNEMTKREINLWRLVYNFCNSTPPIDLRSNPELDLKTILKREDSVTFFINRLKLYIKNLDMLKKLKNRLQKELTQVDFGNSSNGLVEWALGYVRRTRNPSQTTDRTSDISSSQPVHRVLEEPTNEQQWEIVDQPVNVKRVCQTNKKQSIAKARKSKDNLSENKNPTSEIASYSSKSAIKSNKRNKTVKKHSKSDHQIDQPFKCELCSLSYSTTSKLLKHQRSMHQKKLFQRKYCENKYTFRLACKEHERVKHKQKLLSCSQCCQLNQHLRVEHEKKIYKCEECNETFTYYNAKLRHHHRVHVNEQYSCPHCDKVYKLKGDLSNHIKFIHLNNGFKCEHCGKIFNYKFNLTQHIKRIHSKKLL